MLRISRIGVLAITFGVVCGGLYASSAQADDASLAADLSSWTKVTEGELADQRAGQIESSATQTIIQDGEQTVNGQVGPGGSINTGENTFAGGNMVINTLNTGHNVKIANQMIFIVNMYEGAP